MTEKQGGCRATRHGFACTRKARHDGRHIARGLGGIILKTWAPTYRRRNAATTFVPVPISEPEDRGAYLRPDEY